jgi:hypothetical protein
MKARDRKQQGTIRISSLILACSAVFLLNSATFAQERPKSLEGSPQDAARPAAAKQSSRVPFKLEQPHRVEIDGITLPRDTRVTSILAGRVDVKAAGSPSDSRVQLVPGLVTYKRLKLSGALHETGDHIQWFQDMRQGTANLRTGSLIIFGRDLQEIQRFNFFESMPVGFEIDIPHAQWHLIIAFEWFEPA